MDGIEWISVDGSTNIAAFAFVPEGDGGTGRLHVRFLDGREGYYAGVPRSVFDDYKAAASKGKANWAVRRAGYAWHPGY